MKPSIALLALALTLSASRVPAEPVEAGPPVRDDKHIAARRVANWRALKRRNIVMQKRDYSCGAAALATIIRYHIGDPATEDQFLTILDDILTVEEVKDRIKNGLAMSDLRKAAVKAGYLAVNAKLSLEKLFESKVPLLIGIDIDGYKHFVVYRGTDMRYVYLADPIRGNVRVHINDFPCQWQKNLVLAVAKPNVKPKEVSPLTLTIDDINVGYTTRRHLQTLPTSGSVHIPRSSRY